MENTIKINNVELYYRSIGSGTETIVFSHGYLMDNTMFEGQIEALKNQFRCIAFDHRGHGKSEAPDNGYELDNLVKDAISLIDGLELGPVHFVGMSTGGFVGMRIALSRPDILKSLVLMDTSAEDEDQKTIKKYNLMLWLFKNIGWFTVINKVMPIIFHQTFLEDPSRTEEKEKWKKKLKGHNKNAVVAFCRGIMARDNVLDQLSTVKIPTAVIVGANDVATPPAHSKRMADTIPNASFYTVSDAGHSAAIEKPTEVANAMKDFYKKLEIL